MKEEIDYDLGLWYAFHSVGRSPHISVETLIKTMNDFEDDYTEYARGVKIPDSEKWVLVTLEEMSFQEAFIVDQETLEEHLINIQKGLEVEEELDTAISPTSDYNGNIEEKMAVGQF